jgi:predicted hotdog family 3-hydroxylacyl-ACP dehydratase
MNALDDLYTKLPHAGDMRLLDQVLEWDRDRIQCMTESHRSANNPLRQDGGLSVVHAVEYAAQAAAIHGVLSSELEGGQVLLLAAVRDLELAVTRLDRLQAPLQVSAGLEARSGANAIYRFRLYSDGGCCARGAITLMQRRKAQA